MRSALAVSLLVLPTLALSQSPGGQLLPMMELHADIHRIEAEVAFNLSTRMRGLMGRKSMPAVHGMLFVFDSPATKQCMWMRNTLLPLSVAFIDERGKVINVEDMEPQTDTTHCSAAPAKYALEMNLGWFRQRGIGAGAAIGGIERAPAAR
jgi:hypothetical protein